MFWSRFPGPEHQRSTGCGARGRLGFNSTILLETGEEIGSPGLWEFCEAHADVLAADVLIGRA